MSMKRSPVDADRSVLPPIPEPNLEPNLEPAPASVHAKPLWVHAAAAVPPPSISAGSDDDEDDDDEDPEVSPASTHAGARRWLQAVGLGSDRSVITARAEARLTAVLEEKTPARSWGVAARSSPLAGGPASGSAGSREPAAAAYGRAVLVAVREEELRHALEDLKLERQLGAALRRQVDQQSG